MHWDCNQCKNKEFCEKAGEAGRLVKCKFEPLNEEMIDKFCEDLASLLGFEKIL